ncbi:MAG TPA: glycosyltransferase family 2 protein [Pirellulaceae bacterium]|nr:glycosyltransferase family 2 protein [Pirellulaceae bacterium]
MLTTVLLLGLYSLTAAVLLLTFIFCLEVLLTVLPWRASTQVEPLSRLRFAVLIPAHNEQAALSRTLKTLVPTLGQKDWVLVVADNCTDNTAAAARHAGAEVIEHRNPAKRGKAHAIDAGLKHFQSDPPDAVIFLDADCLVERDAVRLLGTAAVTMRRPAQAVNLCEPESELDQLEAVADFGFRLNNIVRAQGLFRLTGSCYLTGTGTALPWALTYNLRDAGDEPVDDPQLGLALAVAGQPPLLVPEARVDSPVAMRDEILHRPNAAEKYGYLKTLLFVVPRLLAQGVAQGRSDLVSLALDLTIPPVSVLAATWVLAFTAAMAGIPLGATAWPALLLVGAGATLVAALFAGWLFHCRPAVRFATLLAAPFCALSLLQLSRHTTQAWEAGLASVAHARRA